MVWPPGHMQVRQPSGDRMSSLKNEQSLWLFPTGLIASTLHTQIIPGSNQTFSSLLHPISHFKHVPGLGTTPLFLRGISCRPRPSTSDWLRYMMALGTTPGVLRKMNCRNVFQDVLKMYSDRPMRVEFEDEIAVDLGGVTRDMFSAFWDKCYSTMFDGSALLVPMLCPQTVYIASSLSLVGSIVSHAYLLTRFLSVRIALPCIIGILCGPATTIPESVVCDAFLDYVSLTEKSLFKDALETCARELSPVLREKLLSILARYGCRQMPTPSNLKLCLLQVARFEFCSKPAAAICLMHSGIPVSHADFWRSMSVEGICSIYRMLTVSSTKVLDILKLPESMNPAEERVSGYLVEMISSIQLRFRISMFSSIDLVVLLEDPSPMHTCDCICLSY